MLDLSICSFSLPLYMLASASSSRLRAFWCPLELWSFKFTPTNANEHSHAQTFFHRVSVLPSPCLTIFLTVLSVVFALACMHDGKHILTHMIHSLSHVLCSSQPFLRLKMFVSPSCRCHKTPCCRRGLISNHRRPKINCDASVAQRPHGPCARSR